MDHFITIEYNLEATLGIISSKYCKLSAQGPFYFLEMCFVWPAALVGAEQWQFLNELPKGKIITLHKKTQIYIFSRKPGRSGPISLCVIVSCTQLPVSIFSPCPTSLASDPLHSFLSLWQPIEYRTQVLWTTFPQTCYLSSMNFSMSLMRVESLPTLQLPPSSETLHLFKSLW